MRHAHYRSIVIVSFLLRYISFFESEGCTQLGVYLKNLNALCIFWNFLFSRSFFWYFLVFFANFIFFLIGTYVNDTFNNCLQLKLFKHTVYDFFFILTVLHVLHRWYRYTSYNIRTIVDIFILKFLYFWYFYCVNAFFLEFLMHFSEFYCKVHEYIIRYYIAIVYKQVVMYI